MPYCMTIRPARLSTILLALVCLGTGCEITSVTSLEESAGAYRDAREFLRVDRTTNTDVVTKYGKPREIEQLAEGVLWRYWRIETVVSDALAGSSLGTDRALMAGRRGFQHTVVRKTRLDLYFNAGGILTNYRIWRDAP